jgi:hypothetical protein
MSYSVQFRTHRDAVFMNGAVLVGNDVPNFNLLKYIIMDQISSKQFVIWPVIMNKIRKVIAVDY